MKMNPQSGLSPPPSEDDLVILLMEVDYSLLKDRTKSNSIFNQIASKTGTFILRPGEITDILTKFSTLKNYETSNKLAVHGTNKAADLARNLIREQIPVEFIFTCQAKDVDLLNKDLLRFHFKSVFGVQLIFQSIEDDSINYYQIRLQGNRQCLKRLIEAVKQFCHLLRTHSKSVEMEMRLSEKHIQLVQRNGNLLSAQSDTRICFPKENSVLIRGTLEDVYSTSDLIIGLSPLEIKFHADQDQLSQRIIQISKQMDISVSSENLDDGSHEVTFSTFEWSARHLYELRRLCLNLSNACATIPSIPVSWVQSLTGTHKTFNEAVTQMDPLTPEPDDHPAADPLLINETSNSCNNTFNVDLSAQLSELLADMGLGKFAELFKKEQIDLKTFASMDDHGLQQKGIGSSTVRKRMLKAMKGLKF